MSNALIVDAPDGLPFIDTTRDFDAPLDLVWRAYTEPELIARWMGPRDMTIEDFRFEARDGGSWGYTHRSEDGTPYGFRGVVHSLHDRTSITQTFEFLGMPGHVTLERADFEDLDGRTRVRTRSAFQSMADRDGMLASGMEGGMRESLERLDEVLATL